MKRTLLYAAIGVGIFIGSVLFIHHFAKKEDPTVVPGITKDEIDLAYCLSISSKN